MARRHLVNPCTVPISHYGLIALYFYKWQHDPTKLMLEHPSREYYSKIMHHNEPIQMNQVVNAAEDFKIIESIQHWRWTDHIF